MSFYNITNCNAPTVSLAVTTTSARVQLTQGGTQVVAGEFLCIANIGTSAVWVVSGDATVTATASTGNNICIPAGAIYTVRPARNLDTYVAAVCASGTSTISVSVVTGQ